MKFLSWNCQGFGNPWTVRSLRKLVDQDPKVCFLMETRLDKEGYDKHCRELPFQNKLIVKRSNLSGGLALVWKRDVNLDVINFTENHILAKTKIMGALESSLFSRSRNLAVYRGF